MIALEGIRLWVDGQPALDGLDLAVEAGESVALLGPTGSHTSALLQVILGLRKPDAGRVRVAGQDLGEMDEDGLRVVRRKVGVVLRDGPLVSWMTVAANVASPMRGYSGLPAGPVEGKVNELLGLVGLEGFGRRLPGELSGWMRRRAALARALALDPRILLYDEPTAGLDPLDTQRANRLIRALHGRMRVTSVVLTHDLEGAVAVADRIAFLSAGRIQFVGGAAGLFLSRSPAVQSFLRSADGYGVRAGSGGAEPAPLAGSRQ